MSRNVCKLWQESRFGNWQTENGWARAALTVQTQNLRITRLQLDTKTILHVFSFIYLYIYSCIIIIVVLIHVNTFQPKSVIAQKVFEISHASLGFLFLFFHFFILFFFLARGAVKTSRQTVNESNLGEHSSPILHFSRFCQRRRFKKNKTKTTIKQNCAHLPSMK